VQSQTFYRQEEKIKEQTKTQSLAFVFRVCATAED